MKRGDVAVDTLVIIIIAILILVLAIFFVLGVYNGGSGTTNQSFNYINNTFENVTNTSIPSLLK